MAGDSDPGDTNGAATGQASLRAHQTTAAAAMPSADAAGHLPIEAGEVEPGTDLRLAGRDPFEQVPAAHEQPNQRAADRVGHQPRLMRRGT